MEIYYENKIYSQRTSTSKIIEYDMNKNIIHKYESLRDLPSEVIKEIAKSKDLYTNPEKYFNFFVMDGTAIISEVVNKDELPKNVEIPENIDGYTIGSLSNDLFKETNIEKLTIHYNIDYIGEFLCANCYSLKKVILSPLIEEIPNYAFYSCVKLKEINMPESLKTIESHSFSYSGLSGNIEFPENLQYIATHSFVGCRFNNINIHQNTFIGPSAFDFDSQLNIHEYSDIIEKASIERE